MACLPGWPPPGIGVQHPVPPECCTGERSGACILVVTYDWKHASEHVYAYTDATMTLLNPHQRWILACSLVPLVNLIRANQANADILVGFSQPSPLMTLLSMAAETTMVAETTTVATAANKGTPPHPEQEGIQIMEAYWLEISEAECIWRFRYFSVFS